MDEEVEALARALYEGMANRVKPTWDQLGDVTKSVWRDRATVQLFEEFA